MVSTALGLGLALLTQSLEAAAAGKHRGQR